MSRLAMSLGLVAVSLACLGGGSLEHTVRAADAEEALARATAVRSAVEKLLDPKLAPDRLAARQDWIVRRYRGSLSAAQVEANRANALFQAKRWRECIAAVEAVMGSYPQYTVQQANSAYLLSRIVNNKQAPDEVRRAAFDALLPRTRHCAWILSTTHNYLAGLKLAAAEKYRLACLGEETCGRYAYARQYLWAFLDRYSREAPRDEAIRACQRFLERYGEDSAESIAARQRVIELRATSAAAAREECRTLVQAQKALLSQVKSLEGACDAAIAAGKWDEALRQIEALGRLPAHALEGSWWPAMFKRMSQAPLDVRVRAFRCALDRLPLGHASEDSYVLLTASVPASHAPMAAIAAAWLKKNAHDRLRDGHRVTWLVRQMEVVDAEPRLYQEVSRAAIDVARALEMGDLEAELLAGLGERAWDFDTAAACEAFRRAVKACPGSWPAARAQWQLEFLEGKRTVAQGLLPRRPSCLVDDDRLPAIALPPPPAAVADVVLENGAWQMRKLDPKANLVAGQPMSVSDGSATSALATDGKPQTAWRPERLPAAAVVALRQPSTVKRIVVNAGEQTEILVSLLDAAGAVLARYERSWRFWEQFRTAQHFAPESLALDVLPVPGVCFVRIDVLDVLGASAGVGELEVYAPAYPARASHLLAPKALPGKAHGLTIQWNPRQPEREVLHQPDLESVREFPVMRWNTPWPKRRGPLSIGNPSRSLAVEFFGPNATLIVEKQGKFLYTIDGGKARVLEHAQKDRSEHLLAEDLAPGRHLLILENQALPAKNDTYGPGDLCFAGLKVNAQGRVALAVRFGAAGGRWSPWNTLDKPEGTAVRVADVAGARPAQYQIGLFFDSRDAMAEETASVSAIRETATDATVHSIQQSSRHTPCAVRQSEKESSRHTPCAVRQSKTESSRHTPCAVRQGKTEPIAENQRGVAQSGKNPSGRQQGGRHTECACYLVTHAHPPANPSAGRSAAVEADKSFLQEDLATVARLTAERKVVVAYPKTGTKREYAAAERLARRAGVYLVSDDIGLNLYPGLVLAVGRPLVHRYCRQLLAMKMAWNDPGFLRHGEGLVTLHRNADGQPGFLFVTGESVEAVEEAAQRLLDKLPAHSPSSEPFRLFHADTLEVVYPWQLHPERGPRDLAVRLGRNDRQSVQVGICAARDLDSLEIACSPLRSADGRELPAVVLRPVGAYEWVPFFGDLRLPNLLLEQSRVSMPANASLGVWLTVVTTPETPAGQYRGLLTVTAQGHRQSLPLMATVEPIALPDFARVATYSFAHVPYWFHPWSAPYERALRQLARNEAIHGVSVVGPTFAISTRAAQTKGADPLEIDFRSVRRQMEIFEEEYQRVGRPLPRFLCHGPSLHRIDKESFGEGGNFPPSAARLFARQFAAELKRTGRADRFYLKVADEPRDIAQWAEAARLFHECGLRTMTCHAAHYADIDKAVGVMDPWCPNYQHDVWRPFFRERQRRGEAFWWYCCGVPATRLTGKPVDNLPFYWLTEKWHFDGAMNYAAMGANSYCMPVPFRCEHGMDHRIVFLADGTVLDTTRRELEGDGIRDCKLIELVRSRAAELRRQGSAALAQRIEARLAETVEAVVPYRYGYATAPEAWHRARSILYDLVTITSPSAR